MTGMISQPMMGWELRGGALIEYVKWLNGKSELSTVRRQLHDAQEYASLDVEFMYIVPEMELDFPGIEIQQLASTSPEPQINKPLLVKALKTQGDKVKDPDRFVCFLNAGDEIQGVKWFVNEVNTYNNSLKENETRIQINPPMVEKNSQELNNLPYFNNRIDAKDRLFTSPLWASTVIDFEPAQGIVRASDFYPNEEGQKREFELSSFFKKSPCLVLSHFKKESNSVVQGLSGQFGLQQFNFNEDTSDKVMLLEGLKHFINQYLSTKMSLVSTSYTRTNRTLGDKLNVLHGVSFDPIALSSPKNNGLLSLFCRVKEFEPGGYGLKPWKGKEKSLWHLRNKDVDGMVTSGPRLINACWLFLVDPTEKQWRALSRRVEEFRKETINSACEIYNIDSAVTEIKDIIQRIESSSEKSFQEERTMDKWNLDQLKRLRDFSDFVEEINLEFAGDSRYDQSLDAHPYPDFLSLMVKLRSFIDIYEGVQNLFKEVPDGERYRCIETFRLGDFR